MAKFTYTRTSTGLKATIEAEDVEITESGALVFFNRALPHESRKFIVLSMNARAWTDFRELCEEELL